MTELQKQELTSLNIAENQLQKLKEIFPEAFTEGNKVDWDKLRLTLGENIDTGKERFGMNWPGKADCFKTIQQPSIATLVPDREESINFDNTENLFIEGDNLEVLKLLQKSYLGKVKMIYIDPPYNTGSDFVYPDNYSENLETYLQYTGQLDNNGRKYNSNTETDGRFHSKWMSMIYPRLFLSKNLLKDDGVIFISIDDKESNNLKFLCNEIFGEENFIAMFVHKNNSSKNQAKLVSVSTEYFYCYSKNKEALKEINWRIQKKGAKDVAKKFVELKNLKLPLNEIEEEIKEMYKRPKYSHLSRWNKVDEKGVFKDADLSREGGKKNYTIINPNTNKECIVPNRGWGKSYDELLRLQKEDLIWYGTDDTPPGMKDYIQTDDVSVPDNFWYYDNSIDTRWIKDEFGTLIFENPKPLEMIKNIISLHTKNNDIIIDFFAGSGTTAHSIIELNKEDNCNRKFICVQLPEPTDQKSSAFKAGFINISEISKERIRKVINKINVELLEKSTKEKDTLFGNQQEESNNQKQDLGFKVFKLQKSNFKIWDANIDKEPEYIQQALFEHIDHISHEAAQEAILYELLLKSGFPLATPIETITFADKNVYSVADGELLICLEKELTNEVITAMAEKQPSRVICLDEGFQDNDQLKTNAVKIMASKGVVNFRTV